MTTAALSIPMGSCSLFRRNPSIAIVGAGIGGLTAAYELKKLHLESTLYEATGRTGGRVLTVDDAVVDGAYVDFGAEYVDSTHTALLELSKELEVDLVDLQSDPLIAKYYFFEGQKFSEKTWSTLCSRLPAG